jgi:hypothetical protein
VNEAAQMVALTQQRASQYKASIEVHEGRGQGQQFVKIREINVRIAVIAYGSQITNCHSQGLPRM